MSATVQNRASGGTYRKNTESFENTTEYKLKPPCFGKGADETKFSQLETAIQDRLVLIPKPGITPMFELPDVIANQQVDGLSQLFFKKLGVKTHFGEYFLDII
ncbi:MAG: hypothetical protein KF803_00935 [Cyclobacteriaceae bacterium]|nr:hypothetical protein [Cyclobacteriaceae bacterium]